MAAARQSTFESVTINLEHDIDQQYQYQPGEIIRGKIGIQLHRKTLIQSVYLTITGECICSWEVDHIGRLQSKENYLDATQAIHSAEGLARYLDRGFHNFPFEYRLPENIPSSFIGKYGSVTYILKAVVAGERQGDTTIATEPILVMRKYLLPDGVLEPQTIKVAKTYFSMCSWGKVTAELQINHTGYVPGEEICLQVQVQNHSPLGINAMQAGIIMDTCYHAQKNSITFKQIVNKHRDNYELLNGDGRRWQNVRISVPAYVPESFLNCCDIIDVSYLFQFRIEFFNGKELKVEVPITIGANPKGLALPGHGDENVNIYWTMGPRDLAREQIEELRDIHNTWTVESPEFRESNAQVMNPLFRNESEKISNGDKPHRNRSSRRQVDLDGDINQVNPDSHEYTQL